MQMNFTRRKENVCLLLKCLHEEIEDGNPNSYSITDYWWDISDVEFIEKLIKHQFITLENHTFSFTQKGKSFMDGLYPPNRDMPLQNKIMTYVNKEVKRILACLESEM